MVEQQISSQKGQRYASSVRGINPLNARLRDDLMRNESALAGYRQTLATLTQQEKLDIERLNELNGIEAQYKPTETPAGATALLGTPTMEVGPSGNIGVKCEAFAGAQAGGALSGAFEWVEPDKQGTGKSVVGQANANSNWTKLAEVKVEGNAAVGIGAAGEFGISIADNRLGKL